jgi:Ring finger domain
MFLLLYASMSALVLARRAYAEYARINGSGRRARNARHISSNSSTTQTLTTSRPLTEGGGPLSAASLGIRAAANNSFPSAAVGGRRVVRGRRHSNSGDPAMDMTADEDAVAHLDDAMIPCELCETMVRFCQYAQHVRTCPAAHFVATHGEVNNGDDDSINSGLASEAIRRVIMDRLDGMRPSTHGHDHSQAHTLGDAPPNQPLWIPMLQPRWMPQQLLQRDDQEPDEQDDVMLSPFMSLLPALMAMHQEQQSAGDPHGVGVGVGTGTGNGSVATTNNIINSNGNTETAAAADPNRRLRRPTTAVFLRLPFFGPPSSDDYEINTLIGELLGRVQVGVADVNAVAPNGTCGQDGSVCPICQDDIAPGAPCRTTPCRHVFCPGCIERWFESSKKCPVCMSDVEELHSSSGGDRTNSASSSPAAATATR